MKRKKTTNELASERCDQLWREFYDKNPDIKKKLLEDAEEAQRFREKLGAALRGSGEDLD